VNDSRARLVRILRRTLEQVEQGSQIGPDDPAVTELRRTLLQRIAILDGKRCGRGFSRQKMNKREITMPNESDYCCE
jgi:hypothetical protein